MTDAVKLKNGASVAADEIMPVMVMLKMLGTYGELRTVHELFTRCKNGAGEFTPPARARLVEFKLIEEDGSVRDAVRDIVLSACTDLGADGMRMQDPRAPA